MTVGQRPVLRRCASTATMRRISGCMRWSPSPSGVAPATFVQCGRLPPCGSIDPAHDCPFGKQFGLAFEGRWFPFFGTKILVGVILQRRRQWIFEVPEIGRRDRMAARTNLGFPALLAHGDAAADHLMDIGYREGHVINAGLSGTVENEEIVMFAHSLTSCEDAMVGIFIADREAETF